MQPDRGIVRTYRRSDGLSTIQYEKNTLTCQSADMNNASRDPLHGLVKVCGIDILVLFEVCSYMECDAICYRVESEFQISELDRFKDRE